MSLFNTAACGPSTALLKLGNFSNNQNNVSSSHNNHTTQYQKQQSQGTTNAHRGHRFTQNHLNTINGNLENDFGSFVNATANPRMAPTPSGSFTFSAGEFGATPMKTGNASMQLPNWISEFSRVSINDTAAKSQNGQYHNQKSQLHSQRITGYQDSLTGVTSNTASYVGIAGANPTYSNDLLMRNQLPIFHNMTEHQELHRDELQQSQAFQENGLTEDELFAQAFDMIEQELDLEIAEDPVTKDMEDPNDLSSIAASISVTLQNISNTTDNELMQDKISNSSFLKLMHGISAKQVSLGERGFLLTETGEYVGSNAEELNRKEIIKENAEVKEDMPLDQTNRLPDPLSFLKSSDNVENSSSDQLRNLINSRRNGDDILPRNYDDISDDYRVDE